MDLVRFTSRLCFPLLLCFGISCGGTSSDGAPGAGSTPEDQLPDDKPPIDEPQTEGMPPKPTVKTKLLDSLREASRTGRFRFGQQNATLWGLYDPDADKIVSTNDWFWSRAAGASRGERPWASDSASMVAKNPGVLGLSLDALVFDPAPWNRTEILARAAVHTLEQPGGIVTLDWHAPPCNFDVSRAEYAADIATPLGQVSVDGVDVPIYSAGGGTSFYAESYVTQPIRSRADIPENLQCMCKIANDVPIAEGTHAGLSARTWLVAHAKYVAEFFRTHGLADKPIILRPFHEHTGAWFWWGEPYWNCQAMLDDPGAVSGPDAYRAAYRTFAEAIRSEPGMEHVIFAYSTDKLAQLTDKEVSPAERKIKDPEGVTRDLLRDHVVEELAALGAAYESPRKKAISDASGRPAANLLEDYYLEAYPGDDLIDLLGIDLYSLYERAASPADLEDMKAFVSAVAAVADARAKPYALTEIGTYRLHLLHRVSQLSQGESLTMYPAEYVSRWYQLLGQPSLQADFLAHYGLGSVGDIVISPGELTSMFPNAGNGPVTEDWYNTHLLELARSTGVSYALTWQTYFDGGNFDDKSVYYYVPFPGHPEEDGFRRFAENPAVCFDGAACVE